MLLMLFAVSFFVASRTRQNAVNQMSALNGERALIINNYVENSEKTLIAYSHAKQVTALLKDPDNEKLKAEAQTYTEEFSRDIPYLEGIYISQWDTKVLAILQNQKQEQASGLGSILIKLMVQSHIQSLKV